MKIHLQEVAQVEDYLKDKKLKVIVSPVLAARLCNLGHPILKIKKKRTTVENKNLNETVFLFEETKKFLDDFYKLLKEL